MSSRAMAFGACVAFAAAGAVFADDKADAEKVMKQFQGTWTFESHTMSGEKMSADMLKAITITFEGDKFAVKAGDTVIQAGTQKLNVSKKPFTVDATVTEGEGKGTTMLGIFEIDGDTVKACFDFAGKARPEKFESPAKSTVALVVQKRLKK